jgi:glucose-1-phosphate cytidylyltransferase
VKAILLAGGLGTRLREETEFRPKPMVEVGGRPILWHIMKNLAVQGIRDFIVATGYKSDIIKDYFLNYETWNNDFTVTLGDQDSLAIHGTHDESDWRVTVAYTGDSTMTGGRIHRAAKYLDDEPFFVTYGDGVADVDLGALLSFHRKMERLVTVTAMQPTSRFGILDIDEDESVRSFSEKPVLDGWINIGFFIMEAAALDYLDAECVLEQEPMTRLAHDGQLSAYRHTGFWQPMDTFREATMLNALWDSGDAPWRLW